MERLTCYESILYQLLVFNYATKKSLLLLNFSKDAIYRAVERGLEERTITVSSALSGGDAPAAPSCCGSSTEKRSKTA